MLSGAAEHGWRRALARRAAALLGGPRRRRARGPGQAAFRLQYERFREILARNDALLALIAELEERRADSRPVALGPLAARVRSAAMDAFVMAKNLNQIGGDRWTGLYPVVERIAAELDATLGAAAPAGGGPEVVSLERLRRSDAAFAGLKMATLGEVAAACFPVPRGFAVTTAAFTRFMEASGLWERALRLEQVLELHGPAALRTAAAEVETALEDAPLPEGLERALADAAAALGAARLAVRSSALGEDAAAASHAGLYRTVLDVPPDGLAAAYRRVVASVFSPRAVTYRFERGLAARDTAMAVGVLAMVDAAAAGVLFTRPPEEPSAAAAVLAVTAGLGEPLVGGEADGVTVPVADEDAHEVGPLRAQQVRQTVRTGRRLEALLGGPLDLEWAFDRTGVLWILQARPLVCAPALAVTGTPAGPVLLSGGVTACPGVGAGPVVPVSGEDDLDRFPDGGVLVARHARARYARVLGRCAAVITEVGSPAGHLAILAREAAIPALTGLAGALAGLDPGRPVTVDATARRVLDGLHPVGTDPVRRHTGAVHRALDHAAALVTPLGLTDPTAAHFRPESCRTLHDVARFVHEKSYEVMFHYRVLAGEEHGTAVALEGRLPFPVLLFDVGGGLAGEAAGRRSVAPDGILSAPARAFLDGLLDPAIRWDQPRAVSARGFMSVLGASIAGPPPAARGVGRPSYAILSDRYLNFSTKAGYHFATLDTFLGTGAGSSYAHFRFSGGGADPGRRERRIAFLSEVLRALGFAVRVRSDLLIARLDREEPAAVRDRLADLGRLVLVTRQLDMLMDTDASPAFFTSRFLAGEWDRF